MVFCMKPTKKLLKILLGFAFIIAFSFQAGASGFAVPAKTGDGALVGIAVAAAACIVTAFVTLRLTKNKNKK